MSYSSKSPRALLRGLVIFFLVAGLIPLSAGAVDTYNRTSEVDLVLRQNGRIRGLQLTLEIRFLNMGDEFLERVGTDISGSFNGGVSRNGQPVGGAKLIVEAFKVPKEGASGSIVRTGRQTVTTAADGTFGLRLKDLVDSATRNAILAGDIASLRVEATGKNGKKADRIILRGTTAVSGLLE